SLYAFTLLTERENVHRNNKKKENYARVKCRFFCPEVTYKQKDGQTYQKENKEHNPYRSPSVGTIHVPYSIEPVGEDKITGSIDTIFSTVAGKTQIMPDITIPRIEQKGP